MTHASWTARRMPGARVKSTPALALAMVDSGLRTDTFNLVCGARLRSSAVPEIAARIVEHFRSVVRPFSWWVSPGGEPDDLAKRLAEAGLEEQDSEVATVLEPTGAAPEPPTPDGVEIREGGLARLCPSGASLYRSFGFREFGTIRKLKPAHS